MHDVGRLPEHPFVDVGEHVGAMSPPFSAALMTTALPDSRSATRRRFSTRSRPMPAACAGSRHGVAHGRRWHTQGPNAHFRVVGSASPQPCLLRKMLKECNVRTPRDIRTRKPGCAAEHESCCGGLCVRVFVEAGKRSRVPAGKSQGPIAKNTFAIRQMANDLLDRPRVRRMQDARRVLGNIGQESERGRRRRLHRARRCRPREPARCISHSMGRTRLNRGGPCEDPLRHSGE